MNHKILIIDDDQITTGVIEEYLLNFGYAVTTANNRVTGISKMLETKPDLILLDIMLPETDGLQVLKEIKLTTGFSNTPILLLSALNRTNIKVKGLQLGADDYITKPVDKAELLARIQLSIKRASRIEKNSDILEGELSNFTLTDLLQTFEIGKKTGTIYFTDIDGEITIEDGMITKSRQGKFNGEKGLNRIFFLERGKFSVKFHSSDNTTDKERISIINSLMNNITYTDEVNKIFNTLKRNVKGIKDIEKLKKLVDFDMAESVNPVDLKEIIVKMKSNLKENVRFLTKIKEDFPDIFDINS